MSFVQTIIYIGIWSTLVCTTTLPHQDPPQQTPFTNTAHLCQDGPMAKAFVYISLIMCLSEEHKGIY